MIVNPEVIERGVAAAAAELKRQEEKSGCTTDIDDDLAQVDGAFELRPLVRAILAATQAGEPPR